MLQRHSLALALFIILGALAYSNSLSNQFVHDDNYQIVRRLIFTATSRWRGCFSPTFGAIKNAGRAGTSNYYRPLQDAAYRWIVQSSGSTHQLFIG